MSTGGSPNYSYVVGGSLKKDAPSYVVRQADEDFLQALKAGEFCYVLNSRQMGKSSLRVQVMQRLQQEGIICGVVDITSIGSHEIISAEWYLSFVRRLARSLRLRKTREVEEWWEARHSSAVDRLGEFIEEVLLAEISGQIVIFIDEIDSTLRLGFKDDFFAWIRACHNQRTEQQDYQRLTFALLGVATPSALIEDLNRTPFNIGTAIDLSGFRLSEVQPLAQGLTGKAENPQAVMQAILHWTGGQPFLTQKLCQLVLKSPFTITAGSEASLIEKLVQSRIIENWEAQDEPEHLRTIRRRLLNEENQQQVGRLLGLYQQILQQGEIAADGSAAQMKLRLSGLVVQQQGKLKVYNRIYHSVFNGEWVEQELASLRPYAEAIAAWLKSGKQDKSRLLQGEALAEALAWKVEKSLSVEDDGFLTASQEEALATEKKRSQILAEAEKKAKRRLKLASGFSLVILGLGIFQLLALQQKQELAQLQLEATQARVKALNTKATLTSGRTFDALLEALQAGKQVQNLQAKARQPDNLNQSVAETKAVLHRVIWEVRERNTLTGHESWVYSVSYSPDGTQVASASADHTVKIWNLETGEELQTLTGHESWVSSVSYSPDGTQVASASADRTVKIWNLETGEELQTLTGHQDWVYSVSYSPDGTQVASTGDDGTIIIWSWDLDDLMARGCNWIEDYLRSNPDEELQEICNPHSAP